jgi:DNA-binding LacI/PurR family transcriptional regulator
MGALAEANRRGLRVPLDLSVTGFDGVEDAVKEGLTTVRQPMQEKGKAAGRLLLDNSEPGKPRTVTLPTELILGRTTGRPHSSDDRWFGP